MATSGLGAQAIGMAAALCIQEGVMPADLVRPELMRSLQQRLNLAGQSIPGIPIAPEGNLAASAHISASSELCLAEIPFDGAWIPLDYSVAQLLPLKANVRYTFEIEVEAHESTVLETELRYAEKPANYTPDITAERLRIPVEKGTGKLSIAFTGTAPCDQYGFVTFLSNDALRIRSSKARYTGIVSVFNKFNGNLGTMGSLAYLFDHKCVFSIKMKEGLDVEELILDLIDYGVDDDYDMDEEEGSITIYGDPKSFSQIQKHLEENGFEVVGAEFTYIPNDLKDVTPEQRESIDKMIERLEEFDDVQNVYTNMKPAED